MGTTQTLVQEIDAFLVLTGMKDSAFGHCTANDGKFVDRLRGGGKVTLETAERVREFIRSYPKTQQAKKKRSQAAA